MPEGRREKKLGSTTESIKATKPATNKLNGQSKLINTEAKGLLNEICSRIGYLPTGKSSYVLSIDFADALEDLVKLLNSDEGPIILQLGEMQTVSRHLVPMLMVLENRERFERSIFALLDTLGLLTSDSLFANHVSSELLLDYRRQYKRVFESKQVCEAILNLALTCITPRSETYKNDHEFLKKIFILIRNLLAIPDATSTQVSANVAVASSFGKHERLVNAMKECRLLEFLIIAAGSCSDEKDRQVFGPHLPVLVEILQHLFCKSDPDLVAQTFLVDKNGPIQSEIERSLQGEKRMKKPIRHSRFTGAFVVKLSTGEDYVVSASKINQRISLDEGKRVQHRAKKFTMSEFEENSMVLRSSERRSIYELAISFISNESFNEFIRTCETREFDDNFNWHLLRLMSWILRLVRNLLSCDHPPVCISSIELAISSNNLIFQGRALRRFLNERQFPLLISGLIFYREALRMIDYLVHSPHQDQNLLAKEIEVSLFYRQEVISIFKLILQSSFRFSVKALAVLVEVNHILLKLLKKYCVEKGHVFVVRPTRQTDENEMIESTNVDNEREFFFDAFLSEYVTEGIIDAYLRLLRNSRTLESNTNRYIATMFNRFINELKVPFVLYRASLLEAVHEVLDSEDRVWRRKNMDLIKVSELIARLFIQAVYKDPMLMMRIFFGHSTIWGSKHVHDTNTMGTCDTNLEIVRLPEHWSEEEKMAWLARTLVDSEKSTAISWLCSRLFDAAATRDIKVDNQGMKVAEDFYLRAQTDSIKEFFKDPAFYTLLLQCGCIAPTNEDRSWKIPGQMTADEIIDQATILQCALRDTLNLSDNQIQAVHSRLREVESDPEKSEFNHDIPPTLASEATAVIAEIQPVSKWELLKRNNSFLSVIPFHEQHSIPTQTSDQSYEDDPGYEQTPKKPPMIIYSETDD